MTRPQSKSVRHIHPDDETSPLTLDFVLTEVVRILDEERDTKDSGLEHRAAA